VKRVAREASSGEESRYGLSKRTDLLRVVWGVEVAAAKVDARDESFGVVVAVVGVWPLNCARSSSYCLRSLGSWVCRSDRLFPSVSHFFFSSCRVLLGGKCRLTLRRQILALQPAQSRFPDLRVETPAIGLWDHRSCCWKEA
jgi:hypothetical protein